MNFKTALITCLLEKYCCFSGRATRAEFGYFALFFFLYYVLASILIVCFYYSGIFPLPGSSEGNVEEVLIGLMMTVIYISIIVIIVGLPPLLPGLGVMVRRLHDLNRAGWWALLLFWGFLVVVLILLQYGVGLYFNWSPTWRNLIGVSLISIGGGFGPFVLFTRKGTEGDNRFGPPFQAEE